MKRSEGMHFYINIPNFNAVVIDEEAKTGKVNHSIHALDTFFSMIESFGKSHFDSFVVEKITGSRLHMYVIDSINDAFSVVAEVSQYAYRLSSFMSEEIGKYKSLKQFSVQVGACFGRFFDFEFTYGDMSEETTIGYTANFAAKLQGIAAPSNIAISANIYEGLNVEHQKQFTKLKDPKLDKYEQKYYAAAPISKLITRIDFQPDLEASKQYANNVNLTDIHFPEVRQTVNFANISRKYCRKIEGIPFFADVRGFTTQFEKDDSNLEEMAKTTSDILTTMFRAVTKQHGVHIQFQGDREMALFHNYPGYDCVIDAVQTGLRLIDEVKQYSVSIGIGESLGTLFAAKIGARGEKDNILLGTTVTEADKFEDECAGENQLVVSADIFGKIKAVKPLWANHFSRVGTNCYRITVGFEKLVEVCSMEQLTNNNQQQNYNKAWGE